MLFTSFGTKNKAANFSANFRFKKNKKNIEVLLDIGHGQVLISKLIEGLWKEGR